MNEKKIKGLMKYKSCVENITYNNIAIFIKVGYTFQLLSGHVGKIVTNGLINEIACITASIQKLNETNNNFGVDFVIVEVEHGFQRGFFKCK